MLLDNVVVAVQPLSCVWLFVIQWTAGFSVSHYLLEFAQIHVCWVGDTIQPPQPLLLSSSFAFSLSQHQGLLSQWVGFSHQVAKVLKFQLQYQSFQWIFRVDFLWNLLVWSLCNPRDSQESSPTQHFLLIWCNNSSVNPKQCNHILENYSKFIYPFVGDVIFFST